MITHAPTTKKAPRTAQTKTPKPATGNLAFNLDRVAADNDGLVQRQAPPQPGNPPANAGNQPQAAAPTRAQQCVTNSSALSRQAQTRLYDVGRKLISLEAHRVFYPNQAPAPNSQDARVAATTEAYFSSSSLGLLSVLGGRIYHMANCLRDGKVTFSCPSNSAHCGGSGGGFTAAYVASPYHIVFCSLNPGIRTFTHELAHAVLPEVGINRTITTGENVNDRAYSHNRLFHYMTMHEALDNAESYARLVDDIYNNRATNLTLPHADTTNCTNSRDTLGAFARVEKWNHDAKSLLDMMLDYISAQTPATWASLPANYQTLVTNHFPQHNTVAKLNELKNIFTNLNSSISLAHNINCAPAGNRCPANRLSFNRSGYVESTGITIQNQRGVSDWLNVCPTWVTQNQESKVQSLYAAFVLGAPNWMFNPLGNADKFNLVLLAKSLSRETTPLPQSTNIHDHSLRDLQQLLNNTP